MRLGPLDVQILQSLQEDARLSYRELAERLGSTTPTVSARVKALEDIGVLRGYHAHLDPALLGSASYLLSVTVHPKHAIDAHATVAAMLGVQQTFLLPGGRIIAHVHLRLPTYGLPQLHESVAAIEGVQSYEAHEVMQARESSSLGELPEDVEVPCHQCKGPIHAEPVKGKFGARTHVFCCRQCLAEFKKRYESLAA